MTSFTGQAEKPLAMSNFYVTFFSVFMKALVSNSITYIRYTLRYFCILFSQFTLLGGEWAIAMDGRYFIDFIYFILNIPYININRSIIPAGQLWFVHSILLYVTYNKYFIHDTFLCILTKN